MTDREKLAGLISKGRWMCSDICSSYDDCDLCNYSEDGSDCHNTIIADFLIANGVTIQEKGEWEVIGRDRGYVCSNCGSRCLLNYESDWHESKFCPHCGADMRKSDNYD